MFPRPFRIHRASPAVAGSTAIRSRSSKRRAAHLADLSPRGAISLALVVLALVNACATAPPTRRDVVIGLVGEPRSVFDDDPSARFIASAVTETLVRRDAHDELIPRLAESVPTLETAAPRLVTDAAEAPHARPEAACRLRQAQRQPRSAIPAPD